MRSARSVKTVYMEYGYVIYTHTHTRHVRASLVFQFIFPRGIIRGFAKIGCKAVLPRTYYRNKYR